MYQLGIVTLIMLAVGLSMDAFAVAITNGLCVKNISVKQTFQIGLAFGLAQGIMPVLGYFAGKTFSTAIENLDHWIALILLGAIGGKMIVEALQEAKAPESCPVSGVLTLRTLFLQAVATSIDALAVGVSFAVMNGNIWFAAGSIAVTTFVLSTLGAVIGKKSGSFLKSKAEVVGGMILVIIGIKIFVEHTIG